LFVLALTNLFRCLQGLLSCTPLVVDFVGVSTAFSLLVGSEGHSRGLAQECVIIEILILEGFVLAVRCALQGVVLGGPCTRHCKVWCSEGLALGRFGACYRADVC
jgi:hypothetical protein